MPTYYLDATSGDDSRSGLTSALAWKTLAKVNGFALQPGDVVRLKRGGTWRETLTVPASGTVGDPIIFGAYGVGSRPVISAVPVLSAVPEETGGLFVSGFEDETDSLDVDFTQKNTASGNAVAIASSPTRTGAKSLKVEFAGAVVAANAQKTLAAPVTDVYARMWLYLDPGFSMPAVGNQAYLFSLYDNVAAGYPFLIGVNSTNRKEQQWLYVAFQRSGGFTFLSAGRLVTPGVWHSLEAHWVQSPTVGGLAVWWDGVLAASDFTRNTSAYSGRQLFVGGYVGNHAPAAGSKVYFDDVKLSATGPLGDGVTRRSYCIDRNGQSHIALQDIDLHNAGAGALTAGGAGCTVERVSAYHPGPWTAPNDATPPEMLTSLQSIGYAMGGSAVDKAGAIYVHDAASHVRKSIDGGASWATALTFPDALLSGSAILIDSRGYVHACPNGGASSCGIWTSKDSGATWERRLDLSALPQPVVVWGIDEDGEGRLFAGSYTSHVTDPGARIYSSADGWTWTQAWDGVNEGINARHVHGIAADKATGYVYAVIGDGGAWASPITIRSTDHGATWARILPSMPQCVGVACGNGFRLFGTDVPSQRAGLFRSTDDLTYTEVLSVPPGMDCLWARLDQAGHCYAGFGGATVASGTCGVWKSEDAGLTWRQVLALPITATSDGTSYASHIRRGTLVLSQVAGGVAVGGGIYDVGWGFGDLLALQGGILKTPALSGGTLAVGVTP